MKMNVGIVLVLISIFNFCYGQRKSDFDITGFTPIPKDFAFKDRSFMIEKIQPDSNYLYWECLYKELFSSDPRGRIIVSIGDSVKYSSLTKQYDSRDGFFEECHPAICYSYILGIKTDKTVEVVNTNKKLKKFIGQIDNLEEALLVVNLNDLWYDTDTIIGGAYKEREKDYLFYLLDYSSTPVTYKSVRAILTKKGEFKIVGKAVYKRTDEYYLD